MVQKIGFGGGCHWCTEAVFQSLKGVKKVDQGWIATTPKGDDYSEAVIIFFRPEIIAVETLIHIHLLTHSSSAAHSLREKYRSAIYFFDAAEKSFYEGILQSYQLENQTQLVTKVYSMGSFKLNEENYLNYFQKRPNSPFCQTYISPKLALLRKQFAKEIK